MDPKELFDYAIEGMKWLAIGGTTYFGALICGQIFESHFFNKRIYPQKEVESIVEEEAEKLGLDPTKINLIYPALENEAGKNGEGYDLRILWPTTSRIVRHELYHILAGDCDKGKISLPYYLFVAEPRATLYSTLGIKI